MVQLRFRVIRTDRSNLIRSEGMQRARRRECDIDAAWLPTCTGMSACMWSTRSTSKYPGPVRFDHNLLYFIVHSDRLRVGFIA